MLVIAFFLTKEIFLTVFLLSPLVCGFIASAVFGAEGDGEIIHSFLLGICGYLLFCAGLVALVFILGEPVIFVIYMFLLVVFGMPLFFFVPFLESLFGSLFGRLAAKVLER